MLTKKLMGATAAKEKLYVDDVFSTYLIAPNGGGQTIDNGIDLLGEGGLVWSKPRSGTYGATGHTLVDTIRGGGKYLASETTSPQFPSGLNVVTAFTNTGFEFPTNTALVGTPYVSWTFRRAPGFFDIVTYTGDGTSNRQIAHDLGAEPGFITTKSTSAAGDWNSYHRSATGDLKLNLTNAQTASRAIITAADSSTFTVSGVANTSGVTYVAYLWAHDPGEDGIIQCGSFTTDASGNATVNLGWEPQFILAKPSSTAGYDWYLLDVNRAWDMTISDKMLRANASAAEDSGSSFGNPTATGFTVTGGNWGPAGATSVYLAIRRPNKPPKSGTEVFAPVAYIGNTGTKVTTGFPVDWQLQKWRPSIADSSPSYSRLTGISTTATESGIRLQTHLTNAEAAYAPQCRFWDNSGFQIPSAYNSGFTISWNFRRAPGFFDQICYTGTGTNKTEAHNLGKQPELWLAKRRNATGSWIWGSTLLNANEKIVMPTVNGRVTDATAWNSTYPTATNISLGTLADVNASGGTYTLYMWATCPGVSKVGKYTGNGSSQTIDCGFSTGARFVMIIRLTAGVAQDIYLWDSARGITSGNDPRLSLNTTAAEVTGLDTIDPDPSGFIVNQDASNVNVSGAEYLFLAIS